MAKRNSQYRKLHFTQNINKTIELKIIKYENLNNFEQSIFDYTSQILQYYPFVNKPLPIKQIKIVVLTKAYSQLIGGIHVKKIIYIFRSQLQSLMKYSDTLFHELIHFDTKYGDATINFELQQSKLNGKLFADLMNYKTDAKVKKRKQLRKDK